VLSRTLLFAAYAVLNTAAMAAIKEAGRIFGTGRHAALLGRLGFGAVCYAAGLAALITLLRGSDASSVFPVAIGTTVLATNVVGALNYGERITSRKVAATLLLLAGITLTFLDTARA